MALTKKNAQNYYRDYRQNKFLPMPYVMSRNINHPSNFKEVYRSRCLIEFTWNENMTRDH